MRSCNFDIEIESAYALCAKETWIRQKQEWACDISFVDVVCMRVATFSKSTDTLAICLEGLHQRYEAFCINVCLKCFFGSCCADFFATARVTVKICIRRCDFRQSSEYRKQEYLFLCRRIPLQLSDSR